MKTRDVKTTEELRQLVEARELSHIKVGVCDIDGVLRGKYMARDKFFSALEKGFGFCDVILGWDANDQLYENPGVKYTGWHTMCSRSRARPIGRAAIPRHADNSDIDIVRLLKSDMGQAHESGDTGKARHIHARNRLLVIARVCHGILPLCCNTHCEQ